MNSKYLFTLVTGASGGIGKEIARVCAARKMNLVLVARKEEKLTGIAADLGKRYGVKVVTIAADLTDEQSAEHIFRWCIDNNINVNMLINNAGAAAFGEFERIQIERQIDLIKININSLVKLTHLFLPMIKGQDKGYILNVASIAALYPLPYYSVYGATKAFVLSFTQALRFELRNYNIAVSCLCPGDTDTNFFINAGNTNKKKALMRPYDVAETAITSLLDGEEIIFTKNIRFISKLPRNFLKKAIQKRVSTYKLP